MKINVVAFSTNGCRTAIRLKEALKEDDVRLFSKTSSDNLGLEKIEGRTSDWTRRSFEECDALVYIGAIGIAVRYIAPHIRRKDVDPAVVCMDDMMAIEFNRMLHEIGLRAPQDVSLISFNNTEISRYHHPALSTFDVQPYQLGVQAMKLMLAVLKGETEAPAAIDVPFTLIPRDSVAELSQRRKDNA